MSDFELSKQLFEKFGIGFDVSIGECQSVITIVQGHHKVVGHYELASHFEFDTDGKFICARLEDLDHKRTIEA